MVELRLVIGDPQSKKTFQKVVSGDEASKFYGKKLGETFRGELVDLKGYELQITGGSDASGFPMRKGIHSQGRAKILTAPGVGYTGIKKNKKKTRLRHGGLKRKKTVRGEVVADDIAQLNCKVVKAGEVALTEVFKKPEAEKKE